MSLHFVTDLRHRFAFLAFLAFLGSLLLFPLMGCGDDDDDSGEPAVGDACDDSEDMACGEDLVCAADGEGELHCQIPPGGACNPKRDDPGCVLDALCVAIADEDAEHHECRLQVAGVCDPDLEECDPSLRCAELEDGTRACHLPFQIVGQVLDSVDRAGIEGAHVIGLDERSVAVTNVAVSDSDGAYALEIPALRDADGNPVDATYTLRASAADHQTFPGGLRTALPIHTDDAEARDDAWVVEGTLSEVILIALPESDAARYSISGQILDTEHGAGVLVVAEGGGEGLSGISDRDGAYTIFNAVDGDYDVSGYAAGLQLESTSASVDGAAVDGVDLSPSDRPLTTLDGTIQIVNASGDVATSVVLVVESTFDPTFVRGEVPRGLRAPELGPPSVTGSFTIPDVPDGNYVVLAAFENDQLVRDPDTNIAGTAFVMVTVPGDASGGTLTLSESFKVTEALEVFAPGAERPEEVSAAPTLSFADDSSEDRYEVRVFNAYGDLVWEDLEVPSVSGSDRVTVPYGGPLEAGMYYQFRATSIRAPGGRNPAPISATEDLLGVFFVSP